jgi:hypothetical protein
LIGGDDGPERIAIRGAFAFGKLRCADEPLTRNHVWLVNG